MIELRINDPAIVQLSRRKIREYAKLDAGYLKVFTELIEMLLGESITALDLKGHVSVYEKVQEEAADADPTISQRSIPLFLKWNFPLAESRRNCALICLFVIAVAECIVNIKKNTHYFV